MRFITAMRSTPSKSSVPLVLAIACQLASADPATAFQADGAVDPASAAAGRRVAETFVNEVRDRNVESASGRIDWSALLAEATRGAGERGPGAEVARRFSSGFLQDLEESGGLVAQVAQVVELGGGYRFLRMYEAPPLRAIVRLLPPTGGVNYHTLYLSERTRGDWRIVDVGVGVSGEPLSVTLRRGFLALLAETEGDWSAGLSRDEQLYLQHLTELRAMAVALSQQELGRVDGLFSELPPALQKDHGVRMLRLQAAQVRGESEFAQALETFHDSGADSLAADLYAIDAWLQLNRPDAALDAIARIDTAVGGDPFLHVMRGDVHYRAGELDPAEQSARAAIEADPDLQDAWWQLTTISLDRRDFAATADLLTQIARRFEVEIQDLRDVPEYNEFVQSPEYRAWQRGRPR